MTAYSKQLSRDPQRRRRINGNRVIMFHCTSPQSASSIMSGGFLRGSSGSVGGGIYMALSSAVACKLAQSQGAVLECEVKLGNVKIYAAGDAGATFCRLAARGFDSIKYTTCGEVAYAVYNKDQVKVLRKL